VIGRRSQDFDGSDVCRKIGRRINDKVERSRGEGLSPTLTPVTLDVLRLGEQFRGGSTAIEQSDFVLSIERSLRNMAADEARPSNDEHSHVASARAARVAPPDSCGCASKRPRRSV
jgi:hypothetical protein